MNAQKLLFILTLLLATPFACTLSNVSVEPGVSQFYTAGFQIQLTNVTSADWKKDIDIYVLRTEDNIPIGDIYQYPDQKIKFSIPDNGDIINGFFYVSSNYQLDKTYIFWVQACGSQMQQNFTVINQMGIGDQVGNMIIWFKSNVFVMLIAIIVIVLVIMILRPLLPR